jgi:hypothetical protein
MSFGNGAISEMLVSLSAISRDEIPNSANRCRISFCLQPLKTFFVSLMFQKAQPKTYLVNFRALRKWAEMPTRGGKSEQIARWAEISQITQDTSRQDFKHPDDPQYGDNVNDVMTLRHQPISIF